MLIDHKSNDKMSCRSVNIRYDKIQGKHTKEKSFQKKMSLTGILTSINFIILSQTERNTN